MALVILRSFFVMVTVGIAVLIVNSEPMRQAPPWAPWAVMAGSLALPLAVMAVDAAIRRKDLTTITAVYFGLLVGVFLTYVAMLALAPVLPLNPRDSTWTWLPLVLGLTVLLLTDRKELLKYLYPFAIQSGRGTARYLGVVGLLAYTLGSVVTTEHIKANFLLNAGLLLVAASALWYMIRLTRFKERGL
jgi:hypothetical protein